MIPFFYKDDSRIEASLTSISCIRNLKQAFTFKNVYEFLFWLQIDSLNLLLLYEMILLALINCTHTRACQTKIAEVLLFFNSTFTLTCTRTLNARKYCGNVGNAMVEVLPLATARSSAHQ